MEMILLVVESGGIATIRQTLDEASDGNTQVKTDNATITIPTVDIL